MILLDMWIKKLYSMIDIDLLFLNIRGCRWLFGYLNNT